MFHFILLSILKFSLSFHEYEFSFFPHIGVVTEEVRPNFSQNVSSSIVASYVKYLEAGGARAVPIM